MPTIVSFDASSSLIDMFEHHVKASWVNSLFIAYVIFVFLSVTTCLLLVLAGQLASYLNMHFNEILHCMEQTEFSDWTLYSFEQATRLFFSSEKKA